MSNPLEDEVKGEIARHKIVIYAKGTRTMPRCGFTVETIQFFNKYQRPFEVIDVLENMAKRQFLSQMTNWPTLPKVFINGQFYGDTDVLGEMERKGELEPLLKAAFGE